MYLCYQFRIYPLLSPLNLALDIPSGLLQIFNRIALVIGAGDVLYGISHIEIQITVFDRFYDFDVSNIIMIRMVYVFLS